MISDLAADTTYTVHVVATNAAGAGAPTGSTMITIGAQAVNGYWMLETDGTVYAFGDAAFHGSIQAFLNDAQAGIPATTWLNEPIVAIVATPANDGYWLVAADGGTFSFGNAPYRGSVPAVLAVGASLNRPINGMVAYGNGYLMTSTDGGVFTFSDLEFYGSPGNTPPDTDITSLTAIAVG
ncbi:MAG: fibronectin type III domain-containing protein [Actinomycetota bacterium]|nr:fibronectin type III domain-containing protein [Actinomycetota bacterium]